MNVELPGIHLVQRMAHGAAREVIRDLSGRMVGDVRPDELDVSMFVINALIDRAAAGDPASSGDDREFGLGGGELLAMAIVPALMELLGGLVDRIERSGDPGGATHPDARAAAREALASWSGRTGVRVRGPELDRLSAELAGTIQRATAALNALGPGAPTGQILTTLLGAVGQGAGER